MTKEKTGTKPHITTNHSAGFTMIELLMAMVILFIGSMLSWYSFDISNRFNVANFQRSEALSLAQSEIELVRVIPKKQVIDTSYEVAGSRGSSFKVVRSVFDSSKVEESRDASDKDFSGTAIYLRRPLEVRVDVLLYSDEMTNLEGEEKQILVTLYFLKPEYQW
ncbi:MAG: prepilin-type N-terminal cleavage/methylation domain-containing protein [Fibrobacteria bacterium]|nr:prepilin-type N-terminal cleavage/methylation domain-containing protein [Fibrobacteria bacterium]